MPTKTTPTLSDAEQSRERLAQARAKLAGIREEYTAAVAGQDSLNARLKRGDTTVTVSSLSDVATAVRRAETLREAAERELTAAGRAVITDDPDLADALAPLVADALGCRVETATEAPAGLPGDLPVAVLVQRAPSRRDTGKGTLTGRVALHYLRGDLHTARNFREVERLLDDRGVRLTAHGATQALGEGYDDRIALEVKSAWPLGLPVIAPGETMISLVRSFVGSLARDAEQRGHTEGTAQRQSVRRIGDGASSSGMASFGSAHTVKSEFGRVLRAVSDVTDDDGVRTRVAEFALSLRNTGAGVWSVSELVEIVSSAVEAGVGRCCSTLGRVVDVETVETGPWSAGADGRFVGGGGLYRLTFQSQAA